MHSRNKQTLFKYEKVLMINPSEGSPGYIQVISLVRLCATARSLPTSDVVTLWPLALIDTLV